MSYQLLEPGRVFFNLTALEIAAGGSLTFYEVGTTTPKNTYSDPALTILNANPVDLDSAGRSETETWGTGNYDVVLKDSTGATVWTREVNSQVQAGATIPALVADEFLTSDGTTLSWQPVLQVPDPTGSEGALLQVAGGIPTWVAPVVSGTTIVIATDAATIGSGGATNWKIQKGSASAAATAGKTASASVVFPTAYAATPDVQVAITTTSACSTANIIPSLAVSAKSTTGFTVTFSTLTGGTSADSFSASNIVNAVSFDWLANGTVTA